MFNDYEVAPGYMGAPKFEIPTDILDNILLDRELIKQISQSKRGQSFHKITSQEI